MLVGTFGALPVKGVISLILRVETTNLKSSHIS